MSEGQPQSHLDVDIEETSLAVDPVCPEPDARPHRALAGFSETEREIALETLQQLSPHPFLFAVVTGTHHYGFTSPDSDIDVRGSFVSPLRDHVGLIQAKNHAEVMSIIRDREVDGVGFEVARFLELVLKSSGNVIEELFSPIVLYDSGYLTPLREAVLACLTRDLGRHYLGFFDACVRKIHKRAPGEVKMALYAIRIALTGIRVLSEREVEAHLPTLNETFQLDYIEDWTALKITEHEPIPADRRPGILERLERARANLRRAARASKLPSRPEGLDRLHELLVEIRLASRDGAPV